MEKNPNLSEKSVHSHSTRLEFTKRTSETFGLLFCFVKRNVRHRSFFFQREVKLPCTSYSQAFKPDYNAISTTESFSHSSIFSFPGCFHEKLVSIKMQFFDCAMCIRYRRDPCTTKTLPAVNIICLSFSPVMRSGSHFQHLTVLFPTFQWTLPKQPPVSERGDSLFSSSDCRTTRKRTEFHES